MILYYSSEGRQFGDPAIVFGDKANVMLTFYLMYENGVATPNTAFRRMVRARKKKKRTGRIYHAVKHYVGKRRNETLYQIICGEDGEILHEHPLLFALLQVEVDARNCYIIREAPYAVLYRGDAKGNWQPTAEMKSPEPIKR